MSAPQAEDVVEDLVHQFTDPFAFYRELIQNSIDAGSSRIEVALAFRPGKDRGLLTAAVADWGEGMNRNLIENYLVTKFRSTKENDLTKIGKFGIGFVSVFACRPDAVVVDTGRDGESWRVLFKQDRSWELLASPEPLEGTRVTLHKHATAAEYDDFVRQSLAAVKKWCRYSEADVAFTAGPADGSAAPSPSPVREEVSVDAPFQVEHREEGTHVVAGPARTEPPWTGFYNRGLTLLETQEPLVPRVTVRVVSRYLEHTLTRDNVRRDRHFAKVQGLAAVLVQGPLKQALPEESRKAALRPDGAADWQLLFHYARAEADASRLWYRLAGGGAAPFKDVARVVAKESALLVSPSATAVTQRLSSAGVLVLEATPGEALANALALAFSAKSVVLADDVFTFAEPPGSAAPAVFLEALGEALRLGGAATRGVLVARLFGALAEERWARVETPGVPVRAGVARASVFAKGPPLLCLNARHAEVAAAAALFHSAPRLASLLLARCVLVAGGGLTEEVDRALTTRALR
ncbi:MAG: ATP-binding protein [Myxococcales bacterium]|nr:ATP-binding protein [Myxococcales bacterium]